MRRLRWLVLVCAPALIRLLVRFGFARGGAHLPSGGEPGAGENGGQAPLRVTLPLASTQVRRAAADAPRAERPQSRARRPRGTDAPP